MPEKAAYTLANLPGPLRKAAVALKSPLTSLAKSYGIAREKMTEIAPRVVSLFKRIQAESSGFTQADFARMFDPSVPTHAADTDEGIGYRNHRMFYTIGYMIRTVQQANRPRGRQGKRDPAIDQLARTLATVLQVVRDPEPVWLAVGQEFGLQARGIERLKTRVANTKPLIDLSGVLKPVGVESARIVHMPRVVRAEVEVEAAEPARRPAVRRLKRETAAA